MTWSMEEIRPAVVWSPSGAFMGEMIWPPSVGGVSRHLLTMMGVALQSVSIWHSLVKSVVPKKQCLGQGMSPAPMPPPLMPTTSCLHSEPAPASLKIMAPKLMSLLKSWMRPVGCALATTRARKVPATPLTVYTPASIMKLGTFRLTPALAPAEGSVINGLEILRQ